jgi:hypothetical protein
MECIDDGLNLFGPNIRYTVYWRMTILNNMPRDGILVNPEAFMKGIESIFGSGAKQIELAIVNKIKQKFNLQNLEAESLPEAVRYARKQIAELSVIA